MGWLKEVLAGVPGHSRSAPGLRDGRLAGCPAARCCVSTVARDAPHRVAPIGYHCARHEMHAMLVDILHNWPRVRLATAEDDYIHAVQRSRWFGFVDDLECHLPANERLVHLRSAARVGWYDFGVNRARVERLRREVNRRLVVMR